MFSGQTFVKKIFFFVMIFVIVSTRALIWSIICIIYLNWFIEKDDNIEFQSRILLLTWFAQAQWRMMNYCKVSGPGLFRCLVSLIHYSYFAILYFHLYSFTFCFFTIYFFLPLCDTEKKLSGKGLQKLHSAETFVTKRCSLKHVKI